MYKKWLKQRLNKSMFKWIGSSKDDKVWRDYEKYFSESYLSYSLVNTCWLNSLYTESYGISHLRYAIRATAWYARTLVRDQYHPISWHTPTRTCTEVLYKHNNLANISWFPFTEKQSGSHKEPQASLQSLPLSVS